MAKAGKAPMAADEGYCVKCKAKRKISNPQQVKMANGRPALKGVCPVCGTGMFKILRSEEHTSELQSLAYLVCRLLLEKKKKRKRSISVSGTDRARRRVVQLLCDIA